MRILHVISSIDPTRGGPSTALAGMMEGQLAAGVDVGLAATFDHTFNPTLTDQLREGGAAVHLFGPMAERFRGRGDVTKALRTLIERHDVVHIHALWEEIQHRAAALSRRLERPYIMTPHGMLDPWCLAQSRFKKRLYLALRLRRDLQRASAIYYTTETERRLTRPLNLQPPAIVETLGLDLREFESPPPRGAFRGRHPAIGDRWMVLFLSRIHPKKGLDLLVPAFAQVVKKHTSAILVVAGPDSSDGYRAKVEDMIRRYGLRGADAAEGEAQVIFTGMLHGAERIEALADADLFVLPSYQENFGIVVIEAMAAGTPVVISDQVNMHDDVTQAAVGAVVPAEVEPLAKEIDRWLADEALRQAAAARCRPFVREHYDWKKIGTRWKDHYQRVIADFKTSTPRNVKASRG